MAAQAEGAPRLTVLVVEDEPILRLHAADILEGAGYATIEAWNADRALQILEEGGPVAAVFSDIDMPGKADGLALAAAIATRWPEIHVILTSGKMAPPEGIFLPKPYSEERLLSLIRAAIG